MIFNSNTIYGRVWKVTQPKDNEGNPRKYLELQISTSEKQQDESYTYSNWFPRAIGHAFNSLKEVKEGDTIVITKSKFTNEKYEDKEGNKKSAFRFLILEAKIDNKEEPAEAVPVQPESTANNTPAENNDEDPW